MQVDKQGKLKDKSWKGAQKMMNNPEKFLQTLKEFKSVIDDGRVPEQNFKAVEPLLALPHFNREAIQKKSTAAAGLAECTCYEACSGLPAASGGSSAGKQSHHA